MQIDAGGGRTYAFDVQKARNGSPYLVVSEIRKSKEGKEIRNSIYVFPEHVEKFADAVSQMAAKVG